MTAQCMKLYVCYVEEKRQLWYCGMASGLYPPPLEYASSLCQKKDNSSQMAMAVVVACYPFLSANQKNQPYRNICSPIPGKKQNNQVSSKVIMQLYFILATSYF